MPLDVLLIYPNFTSKSLHPPLGLAYLAGELLKNNISVKILDCSFLTSIEEVKEKLKQFNPSVVGLSFLSPMKEDAYKVAEIIKNTYKQVLVVAGGPHPTVFRDDCLKNENINAIIIGEGEITFIDLVKNYIKKKEDVLNNRVKIPGLYIKVGGQIIKNELRQPISDLNSYALPAYELLPRQYFGSRFSIITSRGCPFLCAYCQPTQKMIFGNKLKFDSAQRVMAKLNKIINNSKVTYIMFEDDTFTIDENRVAEICDNIIKEGINKKVHSRCHIRARPLPSEDLLKKMRQANFTNISVGFESGSDVILKELNKGTSAQDNIKAGQMLKKFGFKVFAYIMIGAPSETKDTLVETWQLIKKIKPFEVRVSIVTPLPGTALEKYCQEKNILNKKITDQEKYHYDSFEKLPIKLAISKELLLKYKKKIENYVKYRRVMTKVKEDPRQILTYSKRLIKKFI